MNRRERHQEIVAEIRCRVPEAVGVYIFFDGDGRVTYVGKSVKLRSRMLAYFGRRRGAVHPRLGRMVRGISRFEFRTVETELQALLLEDELIKANRPDYNVRLNEYGEYRYLLLTGDPYPTLKVISNTESAEGTAVFGPFRDRFFARDLLDLIHKYLKLRSCTDPVPDGMSLNFDLGICRGPCRGKISPQEYGDIVQDTAEFLGGRADVMVERIEREMDLAVGNMAYEKAARLRDNIEFCRRFCARQRFVRRFTSERLTVLHRDHADTPHVFVKGYNEKRLNENPEPHRRGDARLLLDRANIIYSWINKNEHRCEYRFEPA